MPEKRYSGGAMLLIAVAAVFATYLFMQQSASGKAKKKSPPPSIKLDSSGRTNSKTFGSTVIKVLEPVYYRGLTVFPLVMTQRGSVKYKTIEDAIRDGDVEITEVDESGNVPELLLNNKSGNKILLVGGEELVGAKQNRIVNVSMLIGGHSKVRIPVSCVEHGRWSYSSNKFAPGEMANAETRAKQAAKVQDNIKSYNTYEADQQQVWDEVGALNNDLGASAPTGAMNDGYKAEKTNIEKYVKYMPLPKNANGYIAFAGSEPLSGDVFDSTQTLRKKWDKLIGSAAMEIIRRHGDYSQADMEDARRFLREAVDSIGDSYSPPGIGRGYHIDGDYVVGNILSYDNVILHFSMFKRGTAWKSGGDRPGSIEIE